MTIAAERRFVAQWIVVAVVLLAPSVPFLQPLVAGPLDSGSSPDTIPVDNNLSQNVPNPFCSLEGGTEIRYELAAAAYVRLSVSMITRGAALCKPGLLQGVEPGTLPSRVLVDGFQSPGRHSHRWDGRDDAGDVMPDGDYYYSLTLSGDAEGDVFFAMTRVATAYCGHGDLLFRETWEADTIGAWVVEGGEWEVGTPAHGPDSLPEGDHCVGTVLDSAYSDGVDALLLSPAIELPQLVEGERILVSFSHWYRFASADSGQVGVKPLDGSWEALAGAGFTLHSPHWTPYWTDLSAWAGQDVAVGFRLASDAGSRDIGWFIDDIRVGAGKIVFRNPDGFEVPGTRWRSEGGIWQIGAPQSGPAGAYEGASCAATVLAGDYECSRRASLVSLPFHLNRSVSADQVALRFKHWYDLGSGDSAIVLIRTRGEESPLTPAFTGVSSGWTDAVFDLTPYVNDRIQIALRLVTDEADSGAGWYVDSIAIEGIPNVARSQIEFANTIVGDTSSAFLLIRNQSPNEVSIRSAEGPEVAFSLIPQFAESLEAGVPIAPESFVTTIAHFAPVQSGVHTGNLVFYDRDALDTVAVVDLYGQAGSLILSWLNAHEYPGHLVADRERVSLLAETGNGVHVDSLLLYYRKGGEPEFFTSQMHLVNQDSLSQTYSGAIPSLTVGPRGIELYFAAFNGPVSEATPPAQTPIRLRVSVDNLRFPAPQPAGDYEMISVPLEPSAGTAILGLLQDDLGVPIDYQWRLFTHETDEEGYAEILEGSEIELEHGAAYWLITREGVTIDTEPMNALSTETDGRFGITLEPGWNMIGNPFSFPVAWDSVTVGDMTLEEAWADLIIERWPWTWVAEGGYYDTVSTLQPFRGYWVRNLQESDPISLGIPPLEADTLTHPSPWMHCRTSSSARPDERAGERAYCIRISARCGAVRDRGCVAGLRPESVTEIDLCDRAEPPASPDRFLSIYFPHRDWEHGAGYYACDMREMLSPEDGEYEGHAWRFDVAKNFTRNGLIDEVELEFTGIDSLPDWMVVRLIDGVLLRSLELRKPRTYRFMLGERPFISCDTEARFLLIVGTSAFVESQTESNLSPPPLTHLSGIFPNPLTTATRICYSIGDVTDVRLSVYDIQGTLVRVVDWGRREPGRYEAVWLGNTQRGKAASPGVYFLRFEAGAGIKETQKVVLVK